MTSCTRVASRKSLITTKEILNQKVQKCTDLRTKILKENHGIIKDELGPEDRVNIVPVHLEVDHTRNISPVKAMKRFNIPWHLRKPGTIEFNKILKSEVITKNMDATEWCSQSFPVQKPNSDPISCRWVTDFRNLNRALKRPVWGGESSSQLLRGIDPQGRYFVCFDAISGFHQIRIDPESQKLLNIVTQLGSYNYTVLGQGLCSSQDLFNYFMDGHTKLDENFCVIRTLTIFYFSQKPYKALRNKLEN